MVHTASSPTPLRTEPFVLVSKCTNCPFCCHLFFSTAIVDFSVRDSVSLNPTNARSPCLCGCALGAQQSLFLGRDDPGFFRNASRSVPLILHCLFLTQNPASEDQVKAGEGQLSSPCLAHCYPRRAGQPSPSRGMEGSKPTFLKPWREWPGVCATTSSGQSQGSCKHLRPLKSPWSSMKQQLPQAGLSSASPLLGLGERGGTATAWPRLTPGPAVILNQSCLLGGGPPH